MGGGHVPHAPFSYAATGFVSIDWWKDTLKHSSNIIAKVWKLRAFSSGKLWTCASSVRSAPVPCGQTYQARSLLYPENAQSNRASQKYTTRMTYFLGKNLHKLILDSWPLGPSEAFSNFSAFLLGVKLKNWGHLLQRCVCVFCGFFVCIFIRDVKFASGIKNINFVFYPYNDVC